jgi:hypothetical protein
MKIKHLILTIIAFTFLSCENYLDVNEDPNNPTQNTITPDLLLAGGLHDPYNNIFPGSANRLGNAFMNNWGPNVNSFTGGFLDEFQLRITSNFYDIIWDNLYRDLGTFQLILDNEEEIYDNHKAISRIMKSFYFQYLVDLYGDIPYTEALAGGENLTPTYDDETEIYRDLISELDVALSEIENSDSDDLSVGSEDIVYQGDLEMWRKFANTIKLRILLRQSELALTDGETQTYLNQQFNSLEKDFISENVVINPGYSNAEDKQNPYYALYGFDTQGNTTTSRQFLTATDYAVKFLKGIETENGVQTNIPDPRLGRIYEPIQSGDLAGEILGVQQGADNTDTPPELSKLGDGLIISSEQDGYLMMASESYFLQAEAAFRGYIPGDAKMLFQNGIIESYNLLGLTTAQADSYINQSNSVNLIGWDGSQNKIEAIMTQKWIALNGINGLESWIEYTRTGFPEIPLPITATRDSKPNRLLYPTSEFSTNSANVPQQSTEDAFSTRIFWDVN